ncbi:MAG TPA: hypothetical protein VF607_13870, partial [Verrucomicrobiae bacterium]
SGGFKGGGSTFAPNAPLGQNRRTPDGDRYNYDDGYVLADVSGSRDGYTWYWGYDNANQVGASGANSIDMHRTDIAGLPRNGAGDDDGKFGFEVAYDRQLYKDDWRHLYYGLELAFNWMPISFGGATQYHLALNQVTDTYGYTAGTTPPMAGLPYQGSYGGPGFVLNYPAQSTASSLGSASLLVQQSFDANLWGFRLGPYIEYMPSEKFCLHLSGGLAVGLLEAQASWQETLTMPGGGPNSVTSLRGGGDDVAVLGGFYVGLDAQYKFDKDWSVEGGVQFQDIGTYNHNFGGRVVELNLSRSIFLHAGISYSF